MGVSELTIKRHPLFNQVPGSDSGQVYHGMGSSLVILDQAQLRYRYFSGDDTRYEADLQTNGIDGMKSGFISEVGLEVGLGETHFWIDNLNAGVQDS